MTKFHPLSRVFDDRENVGLAQQLAMMVTRFESQIGRRPTHLVIGNRKISDSDAQTIADIAHGAIARYRLSTEISQSDYLQPYQFELKSAADTVVVNVRHDKYDIYIGRDNAAYGLQRSQWANNYRIGRDGDRDEVIEKYECDIRQRTSVARGCWLPQLLALEGYRLGCWCAPKPCHGDVLVKLIQEYREGRL